MIFKDFFHNLFVLLIISFVIYLIGMILLEFTNFKNHSKYRVFVSSIVGFLFFFVLSSLTLTHFITINLLLVILFFITLKYIKFESNFNFKEFKIKVKEDIPLLFVYPVIFFIYQSMFYFDFMNGDYKSLFNDNYLYSCAIDSLLVFKVENYDVDQVFLNTKAIKFLPYRYFEYYLGYVCTSLFKVKTISSYVLICIPFFVSQMSIGLHSYFSSFQCNRLIKSLIIFLLMFTSALFIPFLNDVSILKYISEQSFLGVFSQKLCFLGSLFFLAYLTYEKHRYISYLILIAIPILHPIYIPSIYGALLTIFFFKIVFNFKKSIVDLNLILFFFLVLIIIFAYTKFYDIYGISYQLKYSTPPFLRRLQTSTNIGLLQRLKELLLIKFPDSLKYIFLSTSNLTIGTLFYLPLLFFVFPTKKQIKSFVYYLIFILLCLFFGFIGVLLKDGEFDNFQLYTAVLILVPLFLQKLLLDKIIIKNSIFSLPVVFFFIAIIFFNLIPIIQMKFKIHNSEMSYKSDLVHFPKEEVLKIGYFVDFNLIKKESLDYLKNKHNRILTIYNPVYKLKQYYGGTILSVPIINDSNFNVNKHVGAIRLPNQSNRLKTLDIIVMKANTNFEHKFSKKLSYSKIRRINNYKFYFLDK
jgi:hypothetical protein